MPDPTATPMISFSARVTRFLLERRVVVFLIVSTLAGWGVLVSPFDWGWDWLPRDPIPTDAIPDIGENQQIVFSSWPGRSPQDVEDQITYPLTVSLLGVPGVKTVRSFSMFGFSSVYIIFNDDADFYWCRSRILERLNSLPPNALPEGVQPALGPDATSMGQVFWYTLEGRDETGAPTGGWDLHELRTLQDWYVRFSLLSVEGVSEVAAIGGYVQEYQIDLDPDLMRVNQVTLNEVIAAIRNANRDVGARTIEVNRVEYLIRGMGFIRESSDIEQAVITTRGDVPVFVRNVARVSLGPAYRQGALDKGGSEAVGGVVVVRYGENPLRVIQKVKDRIREITHGLPKKRLPDGRESAVRIIPFYDRTELIHETLDTLKTTLSLEILITLIVVVVMVAHIRSALLISGTLPLAVLLCFICMKFFGVDANLVALSGIAIAIGTIVDMGIIVTENVIRRMGPEGSAATVFQSVHQAAREVGGAVTTAVATTVIGFLPVFTMTGAEGKLFQPLAFTKTFVLAASLLIALFVVPPVAATLFTVQPDRRRYGWILYEGMIYLGGVLIFTVSWRLGLAAVAVGGYLLLRNRLHERRRPAADRAAHVAVVLGALVLLAGYWVPLGPERGMARNLIFVLILIFGILAAFRLFHRYYSDILRWCLDHKLAFLSLPMVMVLFGLLIWRGHSFFLGWTPSAWQSSRPYQWVASTFPGLGREFMPPLDEGAYLYMPTTMPHASIGEVLDVLQKQDRAISAIPEVEMAVGKLGRAESPLDPAPVSMIETLITVRPEFYRDADGRLKRFRMNPKEVDLVRDIDGRPLAAPDGKPYLQQGRFERDETGRLIPDPGGNPFRLWRPRLDPSLNPERARWPGINKPDDIWERIVDATRIPGTTSASKLQPISARMVMLQSGIRSAMGVKVKGPDLPSIDAASREIEKFLREVPSIAPQTVIADRIIGKPYLEIHIDRQAIAQHGINLAQVLDVIEYAIGGERITESVEGRERYPVRVRYARELRDDLESLGRILVPAPSGVQLPLSQLADILFVRGPQVIKGEDTFLTGYVLFDRHPGVAEVEAVESAREYLEEMIESGLLKMPPGVSFSFAGTYEAQVRSVERLKVILPLSLLLILIVLYFQFKAVTTSLLVFSGIAVAWSGGFLMLWLYAQPWFLDFSVFGVSMQRLFQVHPVNLSVAVWVGFLALFGIASDDGVVMTTYLENHFESNRPTSAAAIRDTVIAASLQRVRPCLMTTATTVIALIPILTSTGRGADLMLPMAIPSVGGMALEVLTMLVVPVLYCGLKERRPGRPSEASGHRLPSDSGSRPARTG
ncbi:MAG: efflux RND transporter permease subunit [Desulfobacterales bacterium]